MTTSRASAVAADQLRALIADELPDLIDIRHDLHAHPELGYEEHRTSEVVQRELQSAGVQFVSGLAGGTGVVAHIPGDSQRAIGLRADMDALPIVEETGLPYASQHAGRMHACGHDGHTTMLIGAARVLAKLSKQRALPRSVTFVFQPAEEGGAGGKRMVEDGCLNGTVLGPPVEMMFGLHGWPTLSLGKVSTRPGPMLAAADKLAITVRGKGSHAAYPHYGNDVILCASAIVNAMQQIASRNVDPLDSVVVSITQFHSGTAHNILPCEAQLHGTCRTLRAKTQALAIERIHEIAQSIATAHRCEAIVQYDKGYPVTENAQSAVDVFNQTAMAALGEDRVEYLEQPVMGGEDFSFYCNEVPSCFFALGLLKPGSASMPTLHHPSFDFNDDAMATGIEMFCRLALRS